MIITGNVYQYTYTDYVCTCTYIYMSQHSNNNYYRITLTFLIVSANTAKLDK